MKTFAIATSAVLLTAVLATAATTAIAQSNEQGKGRGMAHMDTNKDGMIDKTEAAARPKLAERFDMIDTNKDGKLAPDELRAAHAGAKAKRNPAPTPERAQ